MAKKVTVTLVDDFDGSGAADETVEFGLDGVTYEIDLSTKNATKLRGDLKQWVAAGRRVGGRRRGRSGSGRGRGGVAVDYLELRDIGLGPMPLNGSGRLLVAARLGTTRLLDNIAIEIGTFAGTDRPDGYRAILESHWRN